MRLPVRRVQIAMICFGFLGSLCLLAQQPKPRPHTSVPAKQYCQPDQGFCFSYPSTWQTLGQSVGDGVVIAPQQKSSRELWDEITVAAIVPPPRGGEAAITIDQVIDTAMNSLRGEGLNPETLQRQVRTVGDLPAQMLKVRYHDKNAGREWVEELVFIEGPDQEIYSVALKSSPATLGRMEPAFASVLRSWKLRMPQAAGAVEAPGATAASPPPQHN